MKIIIGLGNPGQNYQNTRHNAGFLVIDEFAAMNNFPAFRPAKKFEALVSEENPNNEKVILAKPQTFMNNSGFTPKKMAAHYKIPLENLIIVHDDIDLPLGTIKIVKNRGSAGHKGVESIIKELGEEDFVRLRIGVLPEKGKPKKPEKFVLQNFSKNEDNLKKTAIKKSAAALGFLLKNGIEMAMNEYNK